MKFKVAREMLLTPMQAVNNVVERRQTLPILNNVLITAENDELACLATDMEVELQTRVAMEIAQSGATALPARKLLDICKALPADAEISINVEGDRAKVSSGRSRFTLVTQPAAEFPMVGPFDALIDIELPAATLRSLIDRTQFAMAHQDVRYYLNGLLLEFSGHTLSSVATDGHRLALAEQEVEADLGEARQVIVPRKGVTEMLRLLTDDEMKVRLVVGANHIALTAGERVLTSKLIDGKFPDYERVLPRNASNIVAADRQMLRDGLARASILSNEKFRGVRLSLDKNIMRALAHNPEQEEAEEEIEVEYEGAALEVGFNVSYLLDVLNALSAERVVMELSDANSSCLLHAPDQPGARYVVMPMRL